MNGFARELFESEPVRSRPQMAETEPLADTLTTSIANGDSFRYYPQFRADALEVLPDQEATAKHYAIQLLCQQRCHGGLTIGDTHEVDRPVFFRLARPTDGPHRCRGAPPHRSGDAGIERRSTGVYHQMDPHAVTRSTCVVTSLRTSPW